MFTSIDKDRRRHLWLLNTYGKKYHDIPEYKHMLHWDFDDAAIETNIKFPYYLLGYREERLKLIKENPDKVYRKINEYSDDFDEMIDLILKETMR